MDQLHLDYNQFFSLTTDGIGDSDKNQTDRFMKLVQYIGTWHQVNRVNEGFLEMERSSKTLGLKPSGMSVPMTV